MQPYKKAADDDDDAEATQVMEEETEKDVHVVNNFFQSQLTGTRYQLLSVISEGGFGIVYEASYEIGNQSKKVAVKIENRDKSMQAIEVVVLRAAWRNGCRHFPQLLDYGSFPPCFNFIALTLLGKDLYHLRKNRKNATFSLSTAVRVGIQTMQAIQELHTNCLFVSRDIKPSNFVIGLAGSTSHIYIIDFGLCRKYLDRYNNLRPSRGEIGWRGTFRYGSLPCHLRLDLGRRDDIESWFYMLVEATTGRLPWQTEKDREKVSVEKIRARTSSRDSFLRDCPDLYSDLMSKIDSLNFSDEPPYSYFLTILERICTDNGIDSSDAYDWELTQPDEAN